MSSDTQRTHHLISQPQSGFTLMEVLITVLILSVGLLGLAGLQFNALRSNQSAAQSTIAVLRVIDAADRLRGNLAGVEDGSYDLLTGASEDPGCIQNGCTSTQLAQYDNWSWNDQNENSLPDGEGVICLDSTPNDGDEAAAHGCDGQLSDGLRILAAKVWWDDDHNPDTDKRRHTMAITP